MSRVNLTDGTGRWFDSEKATHWEEDTQWNGSNHISVATGSQWAHEMLFRTASGKWILNQWSNWQGSLETFEEISTKKAHQWLANNGHHDALPEQALSSLEL